MLDCLTIPEMLPPLAYLHCENCGMRQRERVSAGHVRRTHHLAGRAPRSFWVFTTLGQRCPNCGSLDLWGYPSIYEAWH